MNDAQVPIARHSLHAAVTDRVRDMILDGALTPGSRVPERVLCEQLAVSRTPLREALKVLASEGLLELSPNRGARAKITTWPRPISGRPARSTAPARRRSRG